MIFFSNFYSSLWHYVVEVAPALALGFLISGILHEFVPSSLIERHLSGRGLKPILYTTLLGIILPVCCIGSLPIAVGLRKKGVSLGPVLAFLVATPATSVSAIFVSWKLLGIFFTLWLCFTVIILGLVIGIVGNFFKVAEPSDLSTSCPMCEEGEHTNHFHHSKLFMKRLISVLTYSFIDMPKEIGLEIVIGLIVAAGVVSITPIKTIIKANFSGLLGYPFALIVGILMYVCSTASVPMVDAFLKTGLNSGAGLVLLLVGPITSYGTLLVVKKEFGGKILLFYLAIISTFSLLSGYIFSLFYR